MGAGGGGMAQGMTPQMMAVLQMMQSGGGGSPQFSPPAGPMSAPPTGTPMAGYLGATGGVPQAMHPSGQMPTPQAGQMPGLAAAAQPGQGGAGTGMMSPQMMQLMANLKGQQGGTPATLPGALNPNAGAGAGSQNPGGMMGYLQQLFGGGGTAGGMGNGTGMGAGGMT